MAEKPFSEIEIDENKKFSPPPILIGYNFSPKRALAARDEEKLLTMRAETSLICNIKCRYCNGASGEAPPGEISFKAIKDVISQVKDLGGESVVVIGGGEPTIYPDFKDLIKYINEKKGMIPVIFTNTTTMNLNLAKFLYDQNVSVLTKLDSLKEKTQDFLANRKGTFKKIMSGFENLKTAGFGNYSNGRLRYGASFVTTSLTLDETPDIWRFCREENMYPNQELLIPRGRAITQLYGLTPALKQIKDVKLKLLNLDEKKYGHTWLVYAPLTGHGCFQHMYSIYLTSMGYVRPCADIDIERFNVKKMKIKEIIKSPFFELARHIDENLEGNCGECDYLTQCIGCRGDAYSRGMLKGLTPEESLVMGDEMCWK